MAFEKLIEFLTEFYERIVPWVIVNVDEGGVLLRMGKYVRSLEAGPHLKWPLIDVGVTVATALTTQQVGPQSLTTSEGQAFVASAVLKYKVRDPKPLCCDLADEIEVLKDVSSGAMKRSLVSRTWQEIRQANGDLEKEILAEIRKEVNDWGFKVYSFTLIDLSPMRSLRLVQDQAPTISLD